MEKEGSFILWKLGLRLCTWVHRQATLLTLHPRNRKPQAVHVEQASFGMGEQTCLQTWGPQDGLSAQLLPPQTSPSDSSLGEERGQECHFNPHGNEGRRGGCLPPQSCSSGELMFLRPAAVFAEIGFPVHLGGDWSAARVWGAPSG